MSLNKTQGKIMKAEILNYTTEIKGKKIGVVDFKITYDNEKSETFRNVSYFESDGKRWIMYPACKRDDKWYPTYERTPPLKNNDKTVLDAIAKYLSR